MKWCLLKKIFLFPYFVCLNILISRFALSLSHTHTRHTHITISIYICVCLCEKEEVCIYAYMHEYKGIGWEKERERCNVYVFSNVEIQFSNINSENIHMVKRTKLNVAEVKLEKKKAHVMHNWKKNPVKGNKTKKFCQNQHKYCLTLFSIHELLYLPRESNLSILSTFSKK